MKGWSEVRKKSVNSNFALWPRKGANTNQHSLDQPSISFVSGHDLGKSKSEIVEIIAIEVKLFLSHTTHIITFFISQFPEDQ